MKITINEEMKKWVAEYIRFHRKEGTISIHVVFSKFNENFETTFKIDPQVATKLLIADGFLKGCPAKGGFSIWLPEDAGKGQRRPFRSRTKQNEAKHQSATPENQSGETEMKKINEPYYAFEKLPHPETGKVDILEMISYIMQHLSTKLPTNPDMDGGYAIGSIKLVDSMQEAGIPRGQCPEMSRILQEMALVKRYSHSQWGVLDTKALRYFITARSYNIAKDEMLGRHQRNSTIAKLRRKVKKLSGQDVESSLPAEPSESSSSKIEGISYEEEAIQALIEVEELTEALNKAKEQIVELEKERDNLVVERNNLTTELVKRSASTDAGKQAFHERLEAAKQARRS